MDATTIELAPAEGADLAEVEALLEANDLPVADLRSGAGRFFRAVTGGELVGVGGFESYGAVGLLRSVVVPAAYRGEGYGTATCDALEDRAREAGLADLYLLTTTAAKFFAARGYERVDREAAPAAIRESSELTDLCPSSATCMRKPV
jgi:amino-acid N-acetyltransferase